MITDNEKTYYLIKPQAPSCCGKWADNHQTRLFVIPAKVGIRLRYFWIPAFAGMTEGEPAEMPQYLGCGENSSSLKIHPSSFILHPSTFILHPSTFILQPYFTALVS